MAFGRSDELSRPITGSPLQASTLLLFPHRLLSRFVDLCGWPGARVEGRGSCSRQLSASPLSVSVSPRRLPQSQLDPRSYAAGCMPTSSKRDQRVQLLVRTCKRPQWETRSRPMTDQLSAAIEREYAGDGAGELTWVHRRWPHAGIYWVLSPIRFRFPRARFDYVWRDPSPAGCAGHGMARFKRGPEGWENLGGPGGASCP